MIFDFEPWQLDIDIDLTKHYIEVVKEYFGMGKKRNNKQKKI